MRQLILLILFLLMPMVLVAQNKGFTPKPQRAVGDSIPFCHRKSFGVEHGKMYADFRKDGVHVWRCTNRSCPYSIIHEEQCKPIKVEQNGHVVYKCSLHKMFNFVEKHNIENGVRKTYFECEFSKRKYNGRLEYINK